MINDASNTRQDNIFIFAVLRFILSFYSFSKTCDKFQISDPKFWFVMCMKNNELDRELDKLVEGRMKKLNGINLKEEIDFMDNISTISDRDGDEVFGE